MIDRDRINRLFDVPESVTGSGAEIGMIDQAEAIEIRAPLLSVREVAIYLGLSIAATKRIAPAELPYARISARNDRRYLRQDVDAYVSSRKVER